MKDSFFAKLITCLAAGLTTIGVLLLIGNGGSLAWLPPVLVFSMVGTVFFASVVFPFVWQYKERTGKMKSEKIHGFLHTTIRYNLAFDLASFGWKKVFGLQFIVPHEISDQPMNQQTGEWLTWYYFGFSPTFGFILASIQIAGAFLLLFRKTSLAAAFVLLAFMLNLTLINLCYKMNAGASVQSIITTIGLVFLVSLEYDRLMAMFFKEEENIRGLGIANLALKNIFRVSAILFSLVFTLYLKYMVSSN